MCWSRVAGFGHDADGLLLAKLADQLMIGGHLALGAVVVPSLQPAQPSVAERGYMALDGGPTDSDESRPTVGACRLVLQSKYEHVFCN